jgi:hypothetical protein
MRVTLRLMMFRSIARTRSAAEAGRWPSTSTRATGARICVAVPMDGHLAAALRIFFSTCFDFRCRRWWLFCCFGSLRCLCSHREIIVARVYADVLAGCAVRVCGGRCCCCGGDGCCCSISFTSNVVDYANYGFWEHTTALVRACRLSPKRSGDAAAAAVPPQSEPPFFFSFLSIRGLRCTAKI